MTLAQDYINQHYPLSQRSTVKKLNLINKSLEGNLSLESFTNLEELDCSNNNVTKLTLNSSKLCYLDCSRNNLTNLDLNYINPTKLTYLRISNNNLTYSDLSIFSKFVNLEVLIIGSDVDKKYNNFVGSLSPLQTLCNLKILDISNTNIDNGLEYLPDSLISINCYNDKKLTPTRTVLGILAIYDALRPYNFQINKWRKENISNYTDSQEKLKKKEEELKEYQEALALLLAEKIKAKGTIEVETQTEEKDFKQKLQEGELKKLIEKTEKKFGKNLSEILNFLLEEEKEQVGKIEVSPK